MNSEHTSDAALARLAEERLYHPLLELTRTRLLELLREPEALFWTFVFPVLLAIALGVAFREGSNEHARIALEVSPTTPSNHPVRQALERSSSLSVSMMTSEEAAYALRTGRVDLVVIPGGEGEEGQPLASFRFDPSREESLPARLATENALRAASPGCAIGEIRHDKVMAKGARYIDFLIPGLIGLNLLGSGLWGIGFGLVMLRTRKLLKWYSATPMRRSDFLLSVMLSRLVLLLLEVAVIVVFGWWLFDVGIQGSFLLFGLVVLLGGGAFSGLGLLVGARTRSIEAASGWMNLVGMPMWVLSGTFFAYARFPEVLHPLIQTLPLTAINDGLRGVMNEGATWGALALPLGVLLVWNLMSFGISLRYFRWQ